MIQVHVLLLAMALCFPALAPATATFGEYTTPEFAPARGQTFPIPIRLAQPVAVTMSIFTTDGDLVYTWRSQGPLQAGLHTLIWDGKDADGMVVPNEAYVPVLQAEPADGQVHITDPRQTSGGEVVEELRVEITPTRDIAYYLPAPSRVLIRVGIKGGAMLRSLAAWTPRGAGKNVQRWDGRDQDGLKDIREEKDLGILVTAFRLPEHTILTTGNTVTDYRAYRQSKGWPEPILQPESIKLVRGTTRLAREYYLPCSQYAEPKVTLTLSDTLPRSAEGLPLLKVGQAVTVKTDIPKEDHWLMNEHLYEVAFFVDHVFVAEEEQGYVPLTWRWKVHTLSPGSHLLTVNISGFSGKVGVASLLFEVTE